MTKHQPCAFHFTQRELNKYSTCIFVSFSPDQTFKNSHSSNDYLNQQCIIRKEN